MQLAGNIQTYQKTNDALAVASSLRTAYMGTKSILGSAVVILIAFIAFPVVRLVLKRIIFNLKRDRNKGSIQIDTQNYAHYKDLHQKLSNRLQEISFIKKEDVKNAPWVLQGILKDLQKLHGICSLYLEDLTKALALNKLPNGQYFKHVPADTLWQNRTKAYSYKL